MAGLAEHYSDYPAAGELSRLTERRYNELLDRFETFRITGRLCDVGCGDGQFLSVARARGWEVHGSEYGEAPRRRALSLGLDVRPAPFAATPEEVGTFDVVTATEVIEHVARPRDEAARISQLLRPGGYCYLTTPNFGSLSRRLTGPRWRALEYPEHLNLFVPATLDALLSRVGLTRVEMRTTGISPGDLLAAVTPKRKSPASDSGVVDIDAQLRVKLTESLLLDRGARWLNAALSQVGLGDTIKALYRRPSIIQ